MEEFRETFPVIVKPGFFESRLEIREIFANNGFTIVSEKTTKMSEKIAKQFYADHRAKKFYQEVVDYMTSDKIYVIILKGSIEAARKQIGKTNPKECEGWEIRAIYGKDVMRNAVHCSDSVNAAKREMALLDNLPELSAAGFLIQIFKETTVSFSFSGKFTYNYFRCFLAYGQDAVIE